MHLIAMDSFYIQQFWQCIAYNDLSIEYVSFSIQVSLSYKNNDTVVSFSPVLTLSTIELTC